ncbi:MAG: bifunctional DNA-formamidopyrimidine glycosylase/DNA-(apurinic or apyrimidinic site) lyase [Planctomycetes bacterium]|jgi:formamidopyrimidine-DNA glycosylase|nr:bifunctional DNA-formamidopyrimidine glycosylase/DNA-(apurinic or apyrimidinic site) lyase [Planctomycetota bacterium]
MPEMPEVETIRKDLSLNILGQKIKEVIVKDKKKIILHPQDLIGRSFVLVCRRGKLLYFSLSVNKDKTARLLKNKIKSSEKQKNIFSQYLLIHLRMTGQLIYQKGKDLLAGGHPFSKKSLNQAIGATLPNRFTRAIIIFSDGAKLFFNDIRRFGYLKLVSEKELQNSLIKFGIEPLTKEFTFNNFIKALAQRKTSIKAVLLNQNIISGIGNIYADESLFASGIRPNRQANSLTILEKKKLWQVINKIMAKAIKHRGTTFSNYVDSSGKKGNFSQLLQVYGRKNGACVNCGKILSKTRVAGRGTSYCQFCQK